jgi:exodeoxyribonuclease VII large subunit
VDGFYSANTQKCQKFAVATAAKMSDSSVIPVSRLVALLRDVVEENFLSVWVEGEISNFSIPASGHYYFTLKESDAQLRTVMFRAHNRLLRFVPENGLKVVCRGRVSVYPQRGELQFIAEGMEPCGVGGLQLAFEQLKERLAAEGLFAAEVKRPLPPHPETVGIVTSATGAALQDILQILRRRGSGVRILLAPVKVQGEGAAAEIAQAISDLNRHGQADVLIVGRGGGSLEDLWAFNEEIVARAIRVSRIPVISAVGHETDTTIADFVADLRAPTPSAAAELVARGRLEREVHLDHLCTRLATLIDSRLRFAREVVEGLARRLRSPLAAVAQQRLLLDQLENRLDSGMVRRLQRQRDHLHGILGRLHLLSPFATVARGYAIVTKSDGAVLRDAMTVHPGERIHLQLQYGKLTATVESTEADKEKKC